jgi:hypothetical protein
MTSYCSEQQKHGCLQLAIGTAQHLLATSDVSLEGKCGLSIITIKWVELFLISFKAYCLTAQ